MPGNRCSHFHILLWQKYWLSSVVTAVGGSHSLVEHFCLHVSCGDLFKRKICVTAEFREEKFCELWSYVWWMCHWIPEWRAGQLEYLPLIMRGFDKPSGLGFLYPHWEIIAHPEAQRNCPFFFSPRRFIILVVCLNLSVTPNWFLSKELRMDQVINSTYRYQLFSVSFLEQIFLSWLNCLGTGLENYLTVDLYI